MKKTLFFALGIIGFNTVSAQYGALDPSFGNRGIVITGMGANYEYNAGARQVLINPAGGSYIILEDAFITKRMANGSIDSSYGLNGYGGTRRLQDSYAALQADGKIVIAGSNNTNAFIVVRMTSNGIADSSFGIKGMQTTELGGSAVATSVAIQQDGKIVVAGHVSDGGTRSYFALARYNTDGSPDLSFNGTGQLTTDFMFLGEPDRSGNIPEIHYALAKSMAIQADGKIVAGGYAMNGGEQLEFAMARYETDGKVDSSFAEDGRQTTNFGSADNKGFSIAIQPDGKIVFGGYADLGSNMFAVARYNTDGSPDSSFDGDGQQTAALGSDLLVPNSLIIQPDGRIVMAGYTFNGAANDFGIARFNTDGSPDNSFDGDGILITDFGSGDDYAGSVAIQPDNKLMVAGYSYISGPGGLLEQIAVARYNAAGTLDSSFANNGKLMGGFNQGYTYFHGSALQPDGRLIAAGMSWNGSNYDFALARYTTNGRPDSSFNGNGKLAFDFGGGDMAAAVLLQPDGKIVVGGTSDNHFAVARFNENGTPDNSFSVDGKEVIPMGFADDFTSMVIQADGKLVIVGSSFTDTNYDSAFFALARLNTDGTIDNSFSGDGKVLSNFDDGPSFATQVFLQTDGKFVVAGRAYILGQNRIALARYKTDGSADNEFSVDGKQAYVFGDDLYFGECMAIQNDGKIVVGGYSQTIGGSGTAFVLSRFLPDGSVDNTFGNLGFIETHLGNTFNFGKSLVITPAGKIALAGTTDKFTIVLYNSNGTRDSTFGENGVVTRDVRAAASSIQSVLFNNGSLYATGNGEFPGMFGVVAKFVLLGGPLPVTLLEFNGILKDKTTLLNWKTSGEKEFGGFNVQRSQDGLNFSTIGFVAGHAHGTSKEDYATVDRQPLTGINYYRLQLLDKDRKFTYSRIVSVTLQEGWFTFSAYPNPATNVIYVRTTGINEKATVKVIDAQGKTVKLETIQLTPGAAHPVNVNTLAHGTYILKLSTKTTTSTRKFIRE